MVKLISLTCLIISYIDEKDNNSTNEIWVKKSKKIVEFNTKVKWAIDVNENTENWVRIAFYLVFIFLKLYIINQKS